MKHKVALSGIFIVCCLISFAADTKPPKRVRDTSSGMFSLGTRNTASLFSDDDSPGLGIGGQFRLQLNDRINTEWFADYITSRKSNYVVRNDYHIGWSVMFYPGRNKQFTHFFQPYVLAGHCFDYSKMMQIQNESNYADRWSMATQAGLGTHLNFSNRLDCSVATQYMLHFGKEIDAAVTSDDVRFYTQSHSAPHGHLLVTLSFNYKFADLWR